MDKRCYSEKNCFLLDDPIVSVQMNVRVLAQDCNEKIS